jgi:RNA-binding protein
MTSATLSALKARAQLLDPTVRVGKAGLNEAFYTQLESAFRKQDLVKVKFDDHKKDKKTLAPAIAERSGTTLIMRVGHVAVFHRLSAEDPRP